MTWVEAGKNMAAAAEAAVREMAEGATRTTTTLRNLNYGIDDDGAAKIAEELGRNATLEVLELGYNRIEARCARTPR